ncbi:MAG: SMI1/KNR4 family protein [Pseudomonadota bacterium]
MKSALRLFLDDWNKDLLESPQASEYIDPRYLKAGWLGSAPAAPSEIEAAEKRLAARLPPSYVSFLLETNGWGFLGDPYTFGGPLRPVSKIEAFQVECRDWIEAYTGPYQALEVPDERYFVYGPEQDTVSMRPRYLSSCIRISEVTEGGVYLLNPEVVTSEGEWEAWHFANYLPGAVRCRSFLELLLKQREMFLYYSGQDASIQK